MTNYPVQPYNAFLDTVVASKSAYASAFGSLTFWDSSFDRTFTLVVDTGQLMMDGVSFQDRFHTNTTGGLQRFDGIKEGGTNNSALLAFRSSNANTRTRIDGIASGITIEATSDGFATVGGGIGVTSSGVAITGLQSFTGTDTPGLQLKSLTTAQITALATASALPNGSILLDSTTNRVDMRLNGVTEELIDTRGGQTINGNASFVTTSTASSGVATGISITHTINQTGSAGSTDLNLVKTEVVNGSGSHNFIRCVRNSVFAFAVDRVGNVTAAGNLTASGTTITQALQVGGAGGFFMRSNGAGLEARDTTNSAPGQIWSSINVTGSINRSVADAMLDIYTSNLNAATYRVRIGGAGSLTNSSGVGGSLLINSIINQTGTASSNDFCINRTETALGSGTHNFIDCQVGGSSRFSVNNAGNLATSGTVTNQGIRLLQAAGSTLRGVLNCPSWDVSYVALRNGTLAETAANSGFYQSSLGDTALNAASGRVLSLSIANAPVVSVTSGSVSVTGNLTASGTVQGVGIQSLTNGFSVGNVPLAASLACLRTPNDYRILDNGSLDFNNATTRLLRITNIGNVEVTGNLTASGTGTFGLGTGLQYLYLNGANSGSTTGAAIRIQNAGVDIGILGNVSAITGGTYNANLLLSATSGTAIINGNAGAVILQTGGFDRWQIGANHWYPSFTNVYDLGLTTNRIRDLYVGGINASGTITYSSIAFPELVTNGGFDTDTAWAKGTGWTISGGTAVATGVVSFADISQNLPAVVLGQTYIVRVVTTFTSGNLQIYLGGSGVGQSLVGTMVASGTYTFLFHKNEIDTSKIILFRGNSAFTGTIDNVSVKRAF